MRTKLVSAILGRPWAISEAAVTAHVPLIINLLEGKTPSLDIKTDFSVERNARRPFSVNGSKQFSSFNEADPGSIAIITISGPLMKDDEFCGPVGMDTIGQSIQAADQHPNISAIILKINSPGGTVDGTENLAGIIKSTKKPIISFIDGTAASAAMWLASSADEIIANGDTAELGSIGVMTSFANLKPVFEKMGVEFHDIYATQSTEKNKIYHEALLGNYKPIQKEVLDPLAQIFIDTVKANREGKLDLTDKNLLAGKMYFAKEAVANGLADSIGNFDFAVQRASDLSNNNKSIQNQNTMKKKWMSLLALVGFTAAAGAEEKEISMEETHIDKLTEAVNAKLDLESKLAAELTAKKTAEDALAVANTSITALTTERDALQGIIAKYGIKPGAQPSGNGKEGTDVIEGASTIIDAEADHNKIANEMLS